MKADIDTRATAYHLTQGLRQGGALGAGEHQLLHVSRRNHEYWWIDKGPQYTSLCGFRVGRKGDGVLRLTPMADGPLCRKGGGKWFVGNALRARGFGKLTFTIEELQRPVVITELGLFLAKLVRGERHQMTSVEWQPDAVGTYPTCAWTVAAWERYWENNARFIAARSVVGRVLQIGQHDQGLAAKHA